MLAPCALRGGSRDDPRRNRCGCFLPDLTGLAGVTNVTVVHQDGPDKYTTVGTVTTMRGTKTIAVDPVTHRAYCIAIERGPAPAPAAGATPPASTSRSCGCAVVGAADENENATAAWLVAGATVALVRKRRRITS